MMKNGINILLRDDLKINRPKLKIFFLFFIVFCTIAIHIFAIDKSSHGREVIWETDDNYHEIIKAKNLDSCGKNCLGINNLTLYEKDLLNYEKRYLLEIFLHHTGIEYHFIKSKLFKILNKFVNNWELSQIYFSYIVTSLLVIIFTIFIFVNFNLNISLIASIIILPYVTIKYGFHFSNGSSDLASVFGILSLICLYKLKLKNYLFSLFFSTITIFTHPIGIFMIIFNFVFAFVKNKFLINKNIIIYIFLGILIVSTYFYLDLNYLNSDIAIFQFTKII